MAKSRDMTTTYFYRSFLRNQNKIKKVDGKLDIKLFDKRDV